MLLFPIFSVSSDIGQVIFELLRSSICRLTTDVYGYRSIRVRDLR